MKPSFFKNLGPIKADLIKKYLDCYLHKISNETVFSNFCNIKSLEKDSLSFIHDKKFSVKKKYNGALICSERIYNKFSPSNPLIVVTDVSSAVATLSNLFYRSFTNEEIELLEMPKIDFNTDISKHSIIGRGSIIGKNVKIGDGCVIGYNSVIGDNTTIENNSVITHSIIGENVNIGRNVSIGQQGFGFAINKKENINIFHAGRVILQAGVRIGSNCTIDRGSFEDTIIGENTYFDNLCHVAHNVVIGRNCIFAGMCGIAGSSIIGDNVMAGGQTGIAGHLNIGSNVQIAAQSGVLNDIADNSSIMGHPAINKFKYIKKYKKNYA